MSGPRPHGAGPLDPAVLLVAAVRAGEERDPERKCIRTALEDEGFVVSELTGQVEVLAALADDEPDLVLVDVRRGLDGFELVRAVRAESAVPIVIVSPLADSHDVVAGLEAGADDYVTRPVEVKELTARIRAQIRRATALSARRREHVPRPPVHVGDLELRLEEGIVRRGDEEVALTKTEFRLLADLVENAGRVLSREQLLEQVWGYDYLGDGRLVDAHVRRLRTKVERDPAHPRLIVTVRGLGYRLVR